VAHDPRKVSSRRSETQMIVISHQTIREAFDSPQPVRLGHCVEEGLIVSVAGFTPFHFAQRFSNYLGSRVQRSMVQKQMNLGGKVPASSPLTLRPFENSQNVSGKL
jgi:hypothetical protein